MKDKDEAFEKMKLAGRKKKPQFLKKKQPAHRPSIQSNYSVISLSDVTEESLEIWRGLPEEIRTDPSLASFRKKHERLLGTFRAIFYDFRTNLKYLGSDKPDGSTSLGRLDSGDYDPLPTDENYMSEDDSPTIGKDNELTLIKIHKGNDDETMKNPT